MILIRLSVVAANVFLVMLLRARAGQYRKAHCPLSGGVDHRRAAV